MIGALVGVGLLVLILLDEGSSCWLGSRFSYLGCLQESSPWRVENSPGVLSCMNLMGMLLSLLKDAFQSLPTSQPNRS